MRAWTCYMRWIRVCSKTRTRATTLRYLYGLSYIRKYRCGRWCFPPRRSTRASFGGGTPYGDVYLNYLAIVLADLGAETTMK